MDDAVLKLSALAQEGRLDVFRLLVRAGPEGLAAGEIATGLGVAANTLSSQLSLLHGAGLITRQRAGRSIIYAAHFEGLECLIGYLLEDCCAGNPAICAPIAELASRACCPPRTTGRA